jgi:DNA polymerase-2
VPGKITIFLPDKEKEKLIEAPNGGHFKNQAGLLPLIIENLWKQRDAAKKQNDPLASQAIKILMNSFFGVLANPTCRFYSLEMANSITHFGQFLNKLTASKIREKGYEVIYGDTDSIFFNADTDDVKKAEKIGYELQDYINDFYKKYVKENYKGNHIWNLNLTRLFKKFFDA